MEFGMDIRTWTLSLSLCFWISYNRQHQCDDVQSREVESQTSAFMPLSMNLCDDRECCRLHAYNKCKMSGRIYIKPDLDVKPPEVRATQ